MSKHKDLRSEHHKSTNKYVKQQARTAANKAANIKRAKALKEAADAQGGITS